MKSLFDKVFGFACLLRVEEEKNEVEVYFLTLWCPCSMCPESGLTAGLGVWISYRRTHIKCTHLRP